MVGNNKKNNQQLKNLTGPIDLLSIRTSSLILLSVLSLAFITNLQLKEKNRINVLKTSQEQGEVDEVYPLKINQPIYKLTITGSGFLAKENSYLRIVLVDKNKNEYLVYEAYPLTVDTNAFSFTTACEETCLLDKVSPDYLKIYGHKASYQISKVDYASDLQKLTAGRIIDINLERERIKKEKDGLKITQLNKQIKVKNQNWLAAETSVSKLTYSQKKKLFSKPDGTPVDKLPNLQGFEFYKGGIFELKSDNPTPTPSVPTPTSSLPSSWDWRNVHGENWLTSVKNQNGCGSCWAFATVGTTETFVNLYYNQHLDINLSEQELVSCIYPDGCSGGTALTAMEYIKNTGIVEEFCFPYQARDARDLSCSEAGSCLSNKVLKISQFDSITNDGLTEDFIKENIIRNGVLSSAISSWNHAMVLIGWQTDLFDNKTIWLFKNSSGEDNGFVSIKMDISEFSDVNYLKGPIIPENERLSSVSIACNNKDNDSYCNWGISETKPNTCPSFCKPEKDCDDSKQNLGPFDENYNCRQINLSPTPTTTIAVPTPIITKAYCSSLNPCKPGYYCKCLTQPKEGSGGGCFCERM